MPAISKIRLINVQYEEGNKRYNDELFLFDGHNGAILLENGGGKTVLIQTAIQSILPHVDFADRKIKSTLVLENSPAHIAIEWIINDSPRRYVVTAVSLFMTKHGLDSFRYVYEYGGNDPNGIEGIPFTCEGKEGKRTAERGEIQDYFSSMRERSFLARSFNTIKEYKAFLEEQYHIISSEWESIVKINSSEGGVEAFFDECKSTNQLFDRLLIPTVESSIIGHDEKMFADMFDKQHASFKNYKKLKETLEENEKIQIELEGYVGAFKNLHDLDLEYLTTKKRARGLWNELINQKNDYTDEHKASHEMLEDWKKSDEFQRLKKASYDILLEETSLNTFETNYLNCLAEQEKKEVELQRHQVDYYSYKLADKKRDMKEQENRLTHIDTEISLFDQGEDLVNFQEDLEATKRVLLGFFLKEIEKFEKEIQDLNFELYPINVQIEQGLLKKDELSGHQSKLRETLSGANALIDNRLKDLEGLKQFLLANPNQEDVKIELQKWNERYQFLDEEVIRLQQEQKQLSKVEADIDTELEELRGSYSDIEKERENRSFQLTEINKVQKNLINRLCSVRPQWASLENVYLHEETIKKRLQEKIESLQKERDVLLYKERLGYRFFDDYRNQQLFFSDTFVEQQLSSLKNQVDYLVTGVEYLQTLSDEEREKKKSYPLWPVTLVTTTKSKQQVLQKLTQLSEQLQVPIVVLTTEEAVSVHEENQESWIAPQFWNQNLDVSTFKEWQQQIVNKAQEVTKLREEKEAEVQLWQGVYKAYRDFIEEYPYEEVTQLQEEVAKFTRQGEAVFARIQQQRNLILEIRSKIQGTTTMRANCLDEKQGLETKIDKAMTYLQYDKEVTEVSKKVNKANGQLQEVKKEITRVERDLNHFKEEKQALSERVNNLNNEILIIRRNDDFQDLQALTPTFSSETKKNILERIRDLEFKINKITVSQGELHEKRRGAIEILVRLKKEIDELRKEHSYIDETREFPGDGVQLLHFLAAKITTLKSEVKTLQDEVSKKASQKDTQKGKWEKQIEQFGKEFPDQEIYQFTLPLEDIKDSLYSEDEKLIERKVYLDQEITRITKELQNLKEAEHGLDRFDEGHHFLAPDIIASDLHSEALLDFTYNRKSYVKGITDELTSKKQVVETEKKEVERAKRKFVNFCLNQISDMKLQQMATRGVEVKQTYHEINEFKKNMVVRIEKITNYANEHIRKSDEDLQLFINQIHTHLLTVVDGLKQIPKKTKVKVEDDWKQIFTFSIPEWQEEVGKTRIRDYIEWILGQLESERFKTNEGSTDEGKIRKEIEMWLQSKQLLQMVLNNEVMKVNCRKVTNDNKVSTRSYSWEQSNVWSGGEKWSKNMTLFLGILNYVAEKKQHIELNMKRHRAVILDNPFGKASSEHVLSPVFFVAEQLGFQIIALTAHAEGKFLQDYFPVIYSCRLRGSTDGNKKVMTKEKWLHHAYFQDHEPKTIERLGETEQLALFD
ncbi:MAG: hypothetical protein ACK4M9_17030 [Anaerobacillus sp.]|uniref:hypothetical protein n=1 Tax=Anaerobacillus sp. TaxID=1872506 RepID=UPI00391C4ACA